MCAYVKLSPSIVDFGQLLHPDINLSFHEADLPLQPLNFARFRCNQQ